MLKFKVLKNENEVVDFIYADSKEEVNELFRKIVHSFELCSEYRESWIGNELVEISNQIYIEAIEEFSYTLEELKTFPKATEPYFVISEIAFDRYRYHYNRCDIPCRKKEKPYPVDTFENIDREKAQINLMYANLCHSDFILEMKDTWFNEDFKQHGKYQSQMRQIEQEYKAKYNALPIYLGAKNYDEGVEIRKQLSNIVKA